MAITSIKTGSSFTNLVKYNDFLAGNAAFFPSSYESIASATGTGSSGTITFSSIPATYKHLQIRMIGKITGTGFYRDDLYLRLNGDTGANYSRHQLQGEGTTASAGGAASATYIDCGRIVSSDSAISNVMFAAIIDIQNYDSTTINKTVRIFSGADANLADSSFRIWLGSGAWLNTSAVNSITLRPASSESFTTTTSVALYGIKG